jgi:hypothetical protein
LVAKNGADPAGVAVCVDEGLALDPVVALPPDGKTSFGFLTGSSSQASPVSVQVEPSSPAPTVIAGVNSAGVIDPAKPGGVNRGGFTVNFFDPNQPLTRVHEWNLTLEREVWESTVARVSYVGNHGFNLEQFRHFNQAPKFVPGPWQFGLDGSLFKTVSFAVRLTLRFNIDFFQLLNNPGLNLPSNATGILSLQNSANAPRQLQLTMRATW